MILYNLKETKIWQLFGFIMFWRLELFLENFGVIVGNKFPRCDHREKLANIRKRLDHAIAHM